MTQTHVQADVGKDTSRGRGFNARTLGGIGGMTERDVANKLMSMRSMEKMRLDVLRLRRCSKHVGKTEEIKQYFNRWVEILDGHCKAEEMLNRDILNRRAEFVNDVNTNFRHLLSNPEYLKKANRRAAIIGLADSVTFMAKQHLELFRLEIHMMRAFCGLEYNPEISLSEFGIWHREYIAAAKQYVNVL